MNANRSEIPYLWLGLLVAVLFGVAAWGGIVLTRELGRVAAIWFSNGLLVAFLLSRPSRQWPLLIFASFTANFIVNRLVGDGVIAATGLAAANMIEVLVAAFALRGSLSAAADLLRTPVLLRFFGFAVILAPLLSGSVAAVVLSLTSNTPYFGVLSMWWPADALGMAVMVPLVLGIYPAEFLAAVRGKRWYDVALPLGLLFVVTAAVFMQSSYPLLFLLLPPLLLATFRLGFTGAALGISMVAALAFGFTLADSGPLMMAQNASITARVYIMQLLLAILIVTLYPVCAVIAAQRELFGKVASSEEQFRVIAQHSSDIIIRTDLDGVRRYISPAVSNVLGWAPEELIGTRGVDYVHPDDVGKFSHKVEKLGRGERDTIVGSMRVRHRDGHYVWIETAARLLRDASSGEPIGWVASARDVSARKRMDQIKDEFIATVNHELRTPLTAMLGSVSLALSGQYGAFADGVRRLLELAKSNAERLNTLVNDILDFEKVSSGRMRFEPGLHLVETLIDQAVTAHCPQAALFKVSVRVRHCAAGTAVHVDAGRFQQVLVNLLSNAAKFSRSGGEVEVNATVQGDRCRISVIDHGCGIPRAFRDSVFGGFAQADGSDRRTPGGAGLGMAIAKRMTEGMGGTIGFESEENVGTRFHLEFPVVSAAAQVA